MYFYEALSFILNTASGKVKRRSWENFHITRGFKNACMGVLLIDEDNPSNYQQYVAKPDDMVAHDWEIVQ